MNRPDLEKMESVIHASWPGQPDFGPTHVRRLSQVEIGKPYIWHYRRIKDGSEETLEFEVTDFPENDLKPMLYIKIKEQRNGEDYYLWGARRFNELGLAPYLNPSFFSRSGVSIDTPDKFKWGSNWIEDPSSSEPK